MKSEEIISDVDKYVMNTYGRIPIAVKEGKGSWLWDYEGNKYLDLTTGIAVTNLGHSNPELIETIKNQSDSIIHSSNLFYLEAQAMLSKLLVQNSFADKVFFCNTGTEAVEGAIKLARKWGSSNGNRFKIISTLGSFHGRTFGALSATGNNKYHAGFSPLLDGFEFVPFGEVDPLKELIKDDKICALIVEPIQGENGVVLPPVDYLKEVRNICNSHNVLLILDEIQVGIGRTGKLFAYEHSGIEPDIMTIAKALGGGVPCGAVLAKEQIANSFSPGSHGTTFGGNPLAVSCGATVINTILKNKLLDNTTELGNYFLEKLKHLQGEYPKIIKEVRGKGLILGIEFFENETAKNIVNKTISKGVLTILTAEKVMRILPPLIVTKEEIDFALEKINESVKEVSSNG